MMWLGSGAEPHGLRRNRVERRVARKHLRDGRSRKAASVPQSHVGRGQLGHARFTSVSPGHHRGTYVQDEAPCVPWLLLNGGHPVGSVSDLWQPRDARGLVSSFCRGRRPPVKVLHGRALRAPNPYERIYFPAMQSRHDLDPEAVRKPEVIWEEYLSNRVRTAVTAFRYRVDQLIEQSAVDTEFGPGLIFTNVGGVRGDPALKRK